MWRPKSPVVTGIITTIITMLEFFQSGFLVRALLAGVLTALICPLIGMFLVTRRMSFLADTLAHVSLAGVAVGAVLQTSSLATVAVFCVAAALTVDALRHSRAVSGESGLVLFLSGGLAMAAVVLSQARTINVHLSSVLFGSITTVSRADLLAMAVLSAVVVAGVCLFYKELLTVSLDEDLAAAGGVRVRVVNAVLMMLSSLTVAVATRIVGILLVSALMIIPVITAMQWRQGFLRTLLLAVTFALAAVLGGLAVSYAANASSGGVIVLVAIGLFAGSWLVLHRH